MFPNLKLQIWRTGLRQNRVAQMVDIDETMLSKILNGFREPSNELKGKLATLLECDSAWLFERQENSKEPAIKNANHASPTAEGHTFSTGIDGATK